MKCVVLSLCLSEAVVSAPTALDFTPALNIHGDDVMSIAIIRNAPSAPLQREIVVLPCEQDEVHAVVVEMPEVISCWHTPRPRPGAIYQCRFNRMSNLRQHQCSS
jgi:hypothetical protein